MVRSDRPAHEQRQYKVKTLTQVRDDLRHNTPRQRPDLNGTYDLVHGIFSVDPDTEAIDGHQDGAHLYLRLSDKPAPPLASEVTSGTAYADARHGAPDTWLQGQPSGTVNSEFTSPPSHDWQFS